MGYKVLYFFLTQPIHWLLFLFYFVLIKLSLPEKNLFDLDFWKELSSPLTWAELQGTPNSLAYNAT